MSRFQIYVLLRRGLDLLNFPFLRENDITKKMIRSSRELRHCRDVRTLKGACQTWVRKCSVGTAVYSSVMYSQAREGCDVNVHIFPLIGQCTVFQLLWAAVNSLQRAT